jgi:hypothetical protein
MNIARPVDHFHGQARYFDALKEISLKRIASG